ncbi:hypothetical protein DRQ32_03480 [bacterium]|nr:MAG: hypothetical protein DRQ32_03480 [bacterium]
MKFVIAMLLVLMLPTVAGASDQALQASGIDQFLQQLRDTPVFGESWTGVWDAVITLEFCDGSGEPLVFEEELHFCTGDTAGDDETLICDGTVGTNSFSYNCMTVEDIDGCILTADWQVEGSISGDTLEITTTISTSYSGACDVPDLCQVVSTVATRTSAEPNCVQVRGGVGSWGVLKAQH